MRGIWVFDGQIEQLKVVLSNENPDACPYWDDKQVERLDEALLTYEFSCPEDRPEAREITGEDLIAVRDLDGYFVLFVAKEITEESGEQPTKRVFCENAALELGGKYVRPQTFSGVTAEQALNVVLDGTRWQLGNVEWLGTRDIVVKDYMTVIALLHEMRKAFAGEFRYRVTVEGNKITGRYIDLLARRGQDTGKRFEYAKDTKGIKRIENTEEIATALIGLGKADDKGVKLTFKNVSWSKANGDPADKPLGQDWVGDDEAFQIWAKDGRHIEGIFEDNEETDPTRLLQKTWDALQERKNSKYTYEVDAVLLERVAGLEHEAVRLGDTVRVIDRTFDPPLTLEARVVELERSYSDPSRDKVVLGYYRERLTSTAKVIADLQALISQKEGIWETAGETITKGSTPPASPEVDDLWLDTSVTPNVWKRWDGNQWVKATPTDAAEVGAETPAGAQAKADQAESNANAYTGQYAEKKITRSATAPASPSAGDIWVDTSTMPPIWWYWDGTAWKKMTRTAFSELFGQITGEQIAPESIEPQHIAWLDAALITVGTMLFDRLKGGTLILGGSGNANGVLSIRDTSGVERVRGDSTGMSVYEASFRIVDPDTQVESQIRPSNNMLVDHSFEMIPRTGSADANQTFAVDSNFLDFGNWFWWQASNWANARVLSVYGTGNPQMALFDFQAIVVREQSQCTWFEYVQKDQRYPNGPYTASAYFAAFGPSADTTAYIVLQACDASGAVLGTVIGTVGIIGSQKFVWKRAKCTYQTLPTNTALLKVSLYCSPDTSILADGVQLVPGSYPVVYDPESSLWRHLRGLTGLNFMAPFSVLHSSKVRFQVTSSVVQGITPFRVMGNSDPIFEVTDEAGTRKAYFGYITSSSPNGLWIYNWVAGTILVLANDKTLKFWNGTSWRTL